MASRDNGFCDREKCRVYQKFYNNSEDSPSRDEFAHLKAKHPHVVVEAHEVTIDAQDAKIRKLEAENQMLRNRLPKAAPVSAGPKHTRQLRANVLNRVCGRCNFITFDAQGVCILKCTESSVEEEEMCLKHIGLPTTVDAAPRSAPAAIEIPVETPVKTQVKTPVKTQVSTPINSSIKNLVTADKVVGGTPAKKKAGK